MHRTLSLKIGELNSFLKCPICNGYLIDSYTINECLHSFCKSCIIKYIKRKECCPVCKINIIKDRMSLFLKRDVNLQCIVYKIVPELFKKEMKRRRDFYSTHPKALKFLKKKKILDKEAVGELDDDIFMSDDYKDISLSIEYSETGLAEIFDSARNKELDPTVPRIYLQCPASLSIELLKKFLSIKFDIKTDKLDVMYDDKPLKKDLTLLDVSYIYAWRRTAPMRLFYRVNKEENKEERTELASNPNVLTSIENKNDKIQETCDKIDNLKDSITNKTFDENIPPINNIDDSLNKPTAKSTPQKDLTQNDTQQSRLQIDLSVNNDSKDNSMKNTSTMPNSHLMSQTNTSQNLNPNSENLTITAMVASITKSATTNTNLNKLETVSNSDKENEEEMLPIKTEASSTITDAEVKPKKPKTTKPKKESETDEVQDLSKKKKSLKTNDNNPTKKPKIEEKHDVLNQFNMPFSNKINSQPIYPSNPQTQLPMLQNFQFMPLMYPWNYSQSYQQNQQQQQQQTQPTNNLNHAYLNQKYASQIFDLFQNKSQPYQNYYGQSQQTSAQNVQSQYGAQVNHSNHHFNQYNNYIEDFKKPLANFASFIQEAASYQNNLFNTSGKLNGQVNENSASMDSLKETQMKISESCSLVND